MLTALVQRAGLYQKTEVSLARISKRFIFLYSLFFKYVSPVYMVLEIRLMIFFREEVMGGGLIRP